jgi:hypothetical protein
MRKEARMTEGMSVKAAYVDGKAVFISAGAIERNELPQ